MSNFKFLNEASRLFLSEGYIPKGETPENIFKRISEKCENLLDVPGIGTKIFEKLSRGDYLLPTPAITNFLLEKESPISCFGTYMSDSVASIIRAEAEVGMMSKIGGGTSTSLIPLRPRGAAVSGGGTTGGPVHFAELFQTQTAVISQRSRRGKIAMTLDFDSPDLSEFLKTRDPGHPLQTISTSVSISDKNMEDIISGDVVARTKFVEIIKSRYEKGYPYIFFKDRANDQKPDVYKKYDMDISFSNLCHEIMLPSDEENSFVCCLLGMNAENFDLWKDDDSVELAVHICDAFLTDFINKCQNTPFMERAVRFATWNRAIGIGLSGFHSYLQSKMIPIESTEAKIQNVLIFKTLREKADAGSALMAKTHGKPPLMVDYPYRHATRLAVAPNTSSSFIMGQQSQSIEPYASNYYVKDVAKQKFVFKNPFLKNLLSEKGKDTKEVWNSIRDNFGSVQHLDFLTDHEKKVFKSFREISQKDLLIMNSARQKYVDQGISYNMYVPYGTPPNVVASLIIEGWKLGLKSFYYQLNENAAQMSAQKIDSCSSCEA